MNWKVSTVVPAENVSDVVPEAPNDAMPVGTVAGTQLASVLKSPDPGASFHVASCAPAAVAPKLSATSIGVFSHENARIDTPLSFIGNDRRVANLIIPSQPSQPGR